MGFRIPEAELTCVVGVGAALWDRLWGLRRPAGLHPFRELNGSSHSAPATPGDLFFHIRAHRLDLYFELAQLLTDRLNAYAQVVDEVHGFRSFDERDLLGFVDGTERPERTAPRAAVLIGEEDPRFAGGSYVVAQNHLHDLETWNALTVEEQERAFGRTKLNDIEFPEELKPANSHLALNTIVDENGEQRQIMRFNMPFGRVGVSEFGTYFIGYVRSPEVIEQMLRTCSSANHRATTTGSSTSPPRSPATRSSYPSTSSTTRPPRRPPRYPAARTCPGPATARSGSEA